MFYRDSRDAILGSSPGRMGGDVSPRYLPRMGGGLVQGWCPGVSRMHGVDVTGDKAWMSQGMAECTRKGPAYPSGVGKGVISCYHGVVVFVML